MNLLLKIVIIAVALLGLSGCYTEFDMHFRMSVGEHLHKKLPPVKGLY
jgi:hypothetical protein